MNKLQVMALIMSIAALCISGFTMLQRVKGYKTIDGVIHHSTYGSYPEKVPFEQGMTLMPGQSTDFGVVIDIPIEN